MFVFATSFFFDQVYKNPKHLLLRLYLLVNTVDIYLNISQNNRNSINTLK